MTKLLTESQLAEIKTRAGAATPEPWVYDGYDILDPTDDPPPGYNQSCVVRDIGKKEDAIFIAHSRTDVPALLAHIESLSAELKEANFILEGLRK